MTNSHSIKELKTIDTALKTAIEIINAGGEASSVLELIQQKLTDILPDVYFNLSLLDISTFENEGYTFSDDQKAQIVLGHQDIETLLSNSNKAH